jgi:hypothetical protein
VLKYLPPDARVSLEGALKDLSIDSSLIISTEPIGPFKRNTISPIEEFFVLSNRSMVTTPVWEKLKSKFGEDLGVTHVLVESNGKLVFWAYDGFHPDCTGASDDIPETFLIELQQKGLIASFERRTK